MPFPSEIFQPLFIGPIHQRSATLAGCSEWPMYFTVMFCGMTSQKYCSEVIIVLYKQVNKNYLSKMHRINANFDCINTNQNSKNELFSPLQALPLKCKKQNTDGSGETSE